MSTLSDFRDLAALAHSTMSSLVGKTVTIRPLQGTASLTWTNLSCTERFITMEERNWLSVRGSIADVAIEVARQGSFDGSSILPKHYEAVYNDEVYQILEVKHDDADPSGQASVFTLFCKIAKAPAGEYV